MPVHLPGAFPIDAVIPALLDALRTAPAVVLSAPPGAGKTTRVPLALLDAPWGGAGRIVMLEPRRIAARAAAAFMARTLREPVGETVGYRVRNDARVSQRTRIEVVTEGILTRQLVHDPSLEGVSTVLFDEFHERSLHADTGLALVLESMQALRDDLRLVVMSATLDGAAVQALLERTLARTVPVVQADGRLHPVQLTYRPPRGDAPLEQRMAHAIRDALAAHDGDILAFLPGAAEIHRTEAVVRGAVSPATRIHVLHGTLSGDEQDAAIAPAPPGMRKVVLATSLAETSLTIEGVRVVVDSGLARVPRFSARTGMTRLETVRVTLASATQRAGRAGRVAPGVCIRLWDEAETVGLVPHARPEILDADLAPLVLELATAGVRDPMSLAWLDAPPTAAVAQARETLRLLDALDADGRATPDGERMSRFGTHPRLARLLLRAEALGHVELGATLAALLDARDLLRIDGRAADPRLLRVPVDLGERVALLRGAGTRSTLPLGVTVDRAGVHAAHEQARAFRKRLTAAGATPTMSTDDALGLLVASAYPDRIAQRRDGAATAREVRYVMRSGQGAALDAADPLAREPFLAIADVDGQPPDVRIYRAASLTRTQVETHWREAITQHDAVSVDDDRVRASRQRRLGAIVLQDVALPDVPPEALADALARAAVRRGIDTLPWTKESTQLRDRLRFVHERDVSWPDVGDEALTATADQWLAPQLHGLRRMSDVARVDLSAALRDLLDWQQRSALDTLAPTHLEVPTGSRIAVDYSDPQAPVLAVRLQEVFGWTETPRIHRGEVPVVLHLLSPAHRPVQVTRDLAGFWRTSYFDVRKEMKGRYPKHVWPDDPLNATPTRRAKPRGS
ncbi:MAG: ATP-dependent helicase HrpB [Gemmatimonadaceae bacterium]|nr:ATP-dependent helicase HrpB [Gemmatimonadaceae bacterium]